MDDPGAAGSVRTLVRSRSSCQATGIDVDDDAGRVVRSAALWPQQHLLEQRVRIDPSIHHMHGIRQHLVRRPRRPI